MRRAGLALAGLVLAVLAGCGTKTRPSRTIPGKTLTIYVSVPLHGASSVERSGGDQRRATGA